MYVGEDVSPDFYAWVFPKCDHVAVGTGTVVDKKGIQRPWDHGTIGWWKWKLPRQAMTWHT